MLTYTVAIPDEKQLFFEELLTSMGFESQREDFKLDDETMKISDQRLEAYYKNSQKLKNFNQKIQIDKD